MDLVKANNLLCLLPNGRVRDNDIMCNMRNPQAGLKWVSVVVTAIKRPIVSWGHKSGHFCSISLSSLKIFFFRNIIEILSSYPACCLSLSLSSSYFRDPSLALSPPFLSWLRGVRQGWMAEEIEFSVSPSRPCSELLHVSASLPSTLTAVHAYIYAQTRCLVTTLLW